MMLDGMIHNNDFKRNTLLQCWNNVLTTRNDAENQSIGGVFREKVLTHIVFKEEFTAFSF